MTRGRSMRRIVAILLVGLIGAPGLSHLSAAQGGGSRPETGYAFWSMADFQMKISYLTGYADAEQFYLAGMATVKPKCTDQGKKFIEDFEYKLPVPTTANMGQVQQGLDEFYKD